MIIIDKGENVGNTIKLVSGFILFVIGILIAYETSVYNLLDILFFITYSDLFLFSFLSFYQYIIAILRLSKVIL